MAKPLNVVSEDVIELAFAVPDLRRRPVIGGGCCAVPAQFLIEETLKEVEQVREVAVSDESGVVRVWVTKGGGALEEELKGRIEGLGYGVEESHPETA